MAIAASVRIATLRVLNGAGTRNAQKRRGNAERAEAALCGTTYVFLLPGSTGGVKLGVDKILVPQLDHRIKPCNFVMLLPRIRNEPTGRA